MDFIKVHTTGEMYQELESSKLQKERDYHKVMHEYYRQALDELIDEMLEGKKVTLMMGSKRVEVAMAPKVEKKDGLVFHKDEAIRKSM